MQGDVERGQHSRLDRSRQRRGPESLEHGRPWHQVHVDVATVDVTNEGRRQPVHPHVGQQLGLTDGRLAGRMPAHDAGRVVAVQPAGAPRGREALHSAHQLVGMGEALIVSRDGDDARL